MPLRNIILCLTIVIIALVFWFDKVIFKMVKLRQYPKGYKSVQLTKYEQVWNSPYTIDFTRSFFNPDMWYDSENKLWYVITRYTRGHRFTQFLSCYLSKCSNEDRITMMLFILDDKFQEQSRIPIYAEIEPMDGFKSNNKLWWNGEDPRIFLDETNGKLMIQGTVHRQDNTVHLAHGVLTNEDGKCSWKIERLCSIDGISEQHKNWAYVRKNLFLTHAYPQWKIATMNENGNCRTTTITNNSILNNRLRCTSKFCSYSPNTYLTLLHTYNEFYRTVFCEVDKQSLLPIRYSQPIDFTEADNYVEFPSGLFIEGDYVFVGLGINDIEARIIKIHKDTINEYLQ
jgi:hypothetical protein